MESFTLNLAGGGQVSGLVCLPPITPATPPKWPLIVAVHGGTVSSRYFDTSRGTSAAPVSTALGIPFVAIDRPGYGDSSGLPATPPDNTTWLQEEGRHLHEQILPALWSEFGQRSQCATIVTIAHSLGNPSSIIAAALHADDPSPQYKLGGAILSGWGTRPRMPPEGAKSMLEGKSPKDRFRFPTKQMIEAVIIGEGGPELIDPEVIALNDAGKVMKDMSYGEFFDGNFQWFGYWKSYAEKVRVPVLHGMGAADSLWDAGPEATEEFVGAFTGAQKVETAIVAKAAHCLEFTIWSRAWLTKCFGFAAECACSDGVA